MVTKNQFIGSENRHEKFNQMVERIGEITGIDLKFIRQSGESVLNHWEERNHRKLSTLFLAKDRARHNEIHKMVTSLQRSLEEKIDSNHQNVTMKKIATIAEYWLEDLYSQI
ncbi:hypothetical protein [Candidatus Lokiarchaeum ossiferum]|uniref:hypothetical protein n=1 Tax=Candidatus Lokiarchaeum ossiferum TaxID=2951803 RepID=UPI00352BE3F2